MKLLNFLIGFWAKIVTLLWVHVWKWCYPQSARVIDELARKEIDLLKRGSTARRLIRLWIDLPGIARSQQIAEMSPMTRTIGATPPAEPHWRGLLREWLIWSVAIGWLVIAMSIVTSFAQTGNFLFEYGPDSGRPEIVTPYFKVVALALFAQIILIVSGLTFLRLKKLR